MIRDKTLLRSSRLARRLCGILPIMLALLVLAVPLTASAAQTEQILQIHGGQGDWEGISVSPNGTYVMLIYDDWVMSQRNYSILDTEADTEIQVGNNQQAGTIWFSAAYQDPTDFIWLNDTVVVFNIYGWGCVMVNCTNNTYWDTAAHGDKLAWDSARGLLYWLWYYPGVEGWGYFDASTGGWGNPSNSYTEKSGIQVSDPRDIEYNPVSDEVIVIDSMHIDYRAGGTTGLWIQSGLTPTLSHINDCEITWDGQIMYLGGGGDFILEYYIGSGMGSASLHTTIPITTNPAFNVIDMELNRYADPVIMDVYYIGMTTAQREYWLYDVYHSTSTLVEYDYDTLEQDRYCHSAKSGWWNDGEHDYIDRYVFAHNHSTIMRHDLGMPYTNIQTLNNSVFLSEPFTITAEFTSDYYTVSWGLAVVDGTLPFPFTQVGSTDEWEADISGLSEGLHTVQVYCMDDQDLWSAIKSIGFTYNVAPTINITEPAGIYLNQSGKVGGNVSSDTTLVQVKLNNGTWVTADYYNSEYWNYTIPAGVTGVIDVYARSWDGLSYSDVAHKQVIINVTTPSSTTPTIDTGITVGGADVTIESGQLILLFGGITAFTALATLILSVRAKRRRRGK